MIDCEKFNFKLFTPKQFDYDYGACLNSKGMKITMKEAIDNAFKKDLDKIPIYIATNKMNNPEVQAIKNNYKQIYTWNDLKFPKHFPKLSNIQIQCVEHLILAKSKKFIGALHSSFSEIILLLKMYYKTEDFEDELNRWDVKMNTTIYLR